MSHHNLIDIIDLQHNQLIELKDIIIQEKEALNAQNADLLISMTGAKAKLLDTIKHNDALLSVHPDKSRLSSEPSLTLKVDSAKDLLTQCQQLNAENSSLIELNIASMQRFSQALQVSRNSSSLTYNDKGMTSTISTLGNNIKA